MIGIGEVTGKAFYSVEKGKERVASLTDDYCPHFVNVKWDSRKEVEFPQPVFQRITRDFSKQPD